MNKKSDIVIKVENLSKLYDLGLVGTGTLSKDLNRTWAKLRGKPDPYATLAELNDRTQKSVSDTVWALKDINFSVEKGEVLGIIGKNGAGKSTLLKLLSRITTPTTGDIKLKGRVASLLEVGTGMHPEMTARQNIYLNGAIMGMNRAEVTAKLDEIVDFAGIGKYIDTPIKRFSSGMKVRLGFAVAAFLEPEILIVDEVLAVGDAEFQKKAIGKMQDVSKGGNRTVLFVSHNMASVKSLCTRALLLENGMVVSSGNTEKIISVYLTGEKSNEAIYKELFIQTQQFDLKSIRVSAYNEEEQKTISRSDSIEISIIYEIKDKTVNYDFNLKFKASDGYYLFNCFTSLKNVRKASLIIPEYFLKQGTYYMDIIVIMNKKNVLIKEPDVLRFTVLPDKKELGSQMGRGKTWITPNFEWVFN